jgi:hypothetical protein
MGSLYLWMHQQLDGLLKGEIGEPLFTLGELVQQSLRIPHVQRDRVLTEHNDDRMLTIGRGKQECQEQFTFLELNNIH